MIDPLQEYKNLIRAQFQHAIKVQIPNDASNTVRTLLARELHNHIYDASLCVKAAGHIDISVDDEIAKDSGFIQEIVNSMAKLIKVKFDHAADIQKALGLSANPYNTQEQEIIFLTLIKDMSLTLHPPQ